MTPIWNDEIERIKQDPEASIFLVSFASQTEARSTIHKLSFARQITKDGKTGLALPGHISFKVGRSPDGGLWLLLAGRMSTDESLEAYELFGVHDGEQKIVIPRQVQNRISGVGAVPTEIVPMQKPARIDPIIAPSEIKMVTAPIFAKRPQESTEIKFTPFVAAPEPKPRESSSTPALAAAVKAQESIVVGPAEEHVKVGPATVPVVVAATHALAEFKPGTVINSPAFALPKVAQSEKPDNAAPLQGPLGASSVEQRISVKPEQQPAEVKFTPFVASPAPKPIDLASIASAIAVTKVLESKVVVPEQAPAKITLPVAPVVAEKLQAPIEIKAVPVVFKATQASPKVAPLPETDKVLSVQEPVKVSSVQKVILPKPAPGTANGKSSPSPIEGNLAPVAAETATESAKVVHAPAKVAPTPAVTGGHSQQEVRPAPLRTPDTNATQPGVRVYLAKEGTRQGPFTLEHINTEIAAGRYKDDHFWAWHDGLPEWIPLYKIAGVVKLAKA